jgi:Tubulin-tyrosine ligase family
MPTFQVVGFPHLKAVLLKAGWQEASVNPAFSYNWTGSGKFHRIPGSGYRGAGGKRAFFRILASQGFTKHLPTTYTKLEEVPHLDPQTYFVKGDFGSYSKQIAVFHGYAELQAGIGSLPYASGAQTYVIQPAIPRPMLHKGYKQSFRVYVLTRPTGQVFVYQRIFAALSSQPFSPQSRDLRVHVPAFNTLRIEVTNVLLRWALTRAAADIGLAYTREVSYGAASYALYGVDVLVDNDGKAWVIENNVSCDLSPHRHPGVREAILAEMAGDLYSLLIAPEVLGVAARPGRFKQVT